MNVLKPIVRKEVDVQTVITSNQISIPAQISPVILTKDNVVELKSDKTENSPALSQIRLSGICLSQLQDTEVNTIPGPKHLRLERQLHNSYCIAWLPPAGLSPDLILSYSIYCDGQFMASVKGNDRTKALLEKIDYSKNHQISVRTVTSQGQSDERHSIINIGRDGRLLPAALKVSEITSTTAVVSWTPASQAVEHIVTVDDTHRTTTAPGACKCLITGLPPYSHHTVSIASNSHPPSVNDSQAVSIAFCTLLKDLPAAPLDVQVDAGPQHGTLLVTWLPVSNTTRDGQLSDIVTGYSVYIAGTKVKELSSPTDDHVILGCESLSVANDPRQITVRTSTAYRESRDSQPASLSSHLMQELVVKAQASSGKKPEESGFNARTLSPAEKNVRKINGSSTGKNQIFSGLPQIEITQDGFPDLSADQGKPTKKIDHQKSDAAPRVTRNDGASLKKRDYFGNIQGSEARITRADLDLQRQKIKSADHVGSDNDGVESLIESSELDSDGNQVRIFVGIYDYIPSVMSPNLDAASEELPFSEGQLLKVIGDKDPDGFYVAESNGCRGLVPCNMVSEVEVDDPVLAELLIKESQKLCKTMRSGGTQDATRAARLGKGKRSQGGANATRATPWRNAASARKMVALYDYNPRELSPNVDAEAELPFHANDVVTVYGEVDYDGFYHGEVNGIFGLVPSNFLKPVYGQSNVERHPRHLPPPSSRRSPAQNPPENFGWNQTRRQESHRADATKARSKSRSPNRGKSPNRGRSRSRGRSPNRFRPGELEIIPQEPQREQWSPDDLSLAGNQQAKPPRSPSRGRSPGGRGRSPRRRESPGDAQITKPPPDTRSPDAWEGVRHSAGDNKGRRPSTERTQSRGGQQRGQQQQHEGVAADSSSRPANQIAPGGVRGSGGEMGGGQGASDAGYERRRGERGGPADAEVSRRR